MSIVLKPIIHGFAFFAILEIVGLTPALSDGKISDKGMQLLDATVLDWQGRREVAKQISYSLEVHTVVPAGHYTRVLDLGCEMPSNTYEFRQSVDLLVDFQEGWSKRRSVGETFLFLMESECGRFIPQHSVELFDGENYQNFQPKEGNTSSDWVPAKYDPELRNRGSQTHAMFFQPKDYPVFFAHGLVPSGGLMIGPEVYRSEIDPTIFDEVSEVEEKGRRYVVLSTVPLFAGGKGEYEMWVDPDRESAVIKWTTYVSSRITLTMDIRHEQMKRGWFPASWTIATFDAPEHPVLEEVRVKELEFEEGFERQQFRVIPKPGMIVYDATKNLRFVASENGELGVELGEFLSEEPKEGRYWAILYANMIFIVIVVAVLFFRKRKMQSRAMHKPPDALQ